MPEACAPRSGWTGLLLAGGRSARMGTDKGSLPHHPGSRRDLFTTAVELLQECCAEIKILGGARGLPSGPHDLEVVPDSVPFAGPFHALLEAQSAWSSPWALILPLDMPALHAAFLQHGQERAEQGLATGATGIHAVDQAGRGCFPVWLHRDAHPALRSFQEDGGRSLFAALQAARVQAWQSESSSAAPGGNPFRNLNTPEDLQAWHHSLNDQA